MKLWEEFKAKLGPEARAVADRIVPWKLYRDTTTGLRCFPKAYCEDGTVTMAFTGEFNQLIFARDVFGMSPDQLEECELPGEDEPVGALLTTDEEVKEYIRSIRDSEAPDP